MGVIEKIKSKLFLVWNPWFRKHIICPNNRMRLKKRDVSILCNNCVGAVMAHDLKMEFNSPFVNLWLYPMDFIKFCENISYYIGIDLVFVPSSEHQKNYPVARLGDVTIYFMHYHSEEDARSCWERRKKRINLSAIRCILVERDGCTRDDLVRFSRLPYPTAALVHLRMPEIKNSHYIRGYEDDGGIGNSIEYKKRHYFGCRYYDDFDYVSFFNWDAKNINCSSSL